MKLNELLSGIKYISLTDIKETNIDIKGITAYSKEAKAGDIFIAIDGRHYDGHDFLDEAASKGVEAAIVQETVLTESNILQIKVENTGKILGILAKNFYKDPSGKLRLIGITGTNGKTTSAYLLQGILETAGHKAGLISTIDYRIERRIIEATHTTPQALDFNKLLDEMVKKSISYCVAEVSSHGLEQGRTDGLRFSAAVFTNLSHEHLDYHKTLDKYLEAKLILFKNLDKDAYAVVNKDSRYFDDVIVKLNTDVISYGIEKDSEVTAKNLKIGLTGSKFTIVTPKGEIDIKTPLMGRHNVYNILAAAAVAVKENIAINFIKEGVEKITSVPGRMERIDCGQHFNVFVDYAHTEDALRNVLKTLRDTSANRVILVFGCGGERDKEKRPKMGKVAAELADFTVITNDNPRREDPKTIASEIIKGFEGSESEYAVVLDRRNAIKKALDAAKEDITVLIAGKGHETKQIFKNRVIPFDDRQVVREILESVSSRKSR